MRIIVDAGSCRPYLHSANRYYLDYAYQVRTLVTYFATGFATGADL